MTGPAAAQEGGELFFKDKNIRVVIPAGPGGGWGTSALILAKHMSRYIPGHPTITPQFMPGAGGITAANYLANVAPRDGTSLSIPLKDIAQTQITQSGVRYDSNAFEWIGRIAPVRTVLVVWHKAPAASIEGIRKTEVIAGALGKNDQGYMMPIFLNHFAGTKFRVIPGFAGGADMFLAMERGDLHAWAGAWDATAAFRGDWIRDGRLIPIVQFSLSKTPALPHVPLLGEFSKSEDDQRLIELLVAGSEIGRSLVAAPGVPKERIDILRRAFTAAVQDKQVIAEFARAQIEVEPLSGPEIAAQIGRIVSTPPSLLKQFASILQGG
jgi:tripartite-type tricarboxylate transporter receptor subunit TctC